MFQVVQPIDLLSVQFKVFYQLDKHFFLNFFSHIPSTFFKLSCEILRKKLTR